MDFATSNDDVDFVTTCDCGRGLTSFLFSFMLGLCSLLLNVNHILIISWILSISAAFAYIGSGVSNPFKMNVKCLIGLSTALFIVYFNIFFFFLDLGITSLFISTFMVGILLGNIPIINMMFRLNSWYDKFVHRENCSKV